MLAFRAKKGLIIVSPWFVVVVHLGHVIVIKDLSQGDLVELVSSPQLELPFGIERPAPVVLVFIFPALREADPRLSFNIIKPHILSPGPVRPGILTSYRAGMAADTLIKVQYHPNLCFNLHSSSPSLTFVR